MNVLRRSVWILIGAAGLPGLVVGIVTLYAFLLVPILFGLGLAVGRSAAGIGVALGVFCLVVLAFMIGLVYGYGGRDWWFFSIYGTSCLFAVLATFKIGQEARVRLFQTS